MVHLRLKNWYTIAFANLSILFFWFQGWSCKDHRVISLKLQLIVLDSTFVVATEPYIEEAQSKNKKSKTLRNMII